MLGAHLVSGLRHCLRPYARQSTADARTPAPSRSAGPVAVDAQPMGMDLAASSPVLWHDSQLSEMQAPDQLAAQVTLGFHMLNIPIGLSFQIQACSE